MIQTSDAQQIEILKEILRRRKAGENLADFTSYMFDVTPAKHHRIICQTLDSILDTRRPRRVGIMAPPGSAKSTYTSYALPAHAMGKKRKIKIIAAAHTQEFADTWGKKVRNLINSQRYQAIYPDVRISDDTRAANLWNTTTGGEYYAVGVGGPISGKRADIVLIDDPYKNRRDAMSPTYRQTVIDWFFADVRPRLLPGASIIIIQTRWHEQDLLGELIERMKTKTGDEYKLIIFKAIWEPSAKNPLEVDPLGRLPGEPLWPEWQPLDELIKIKETSDIYDWQSLYQQEPGSEEGMIVQKSWFKTYKRRPDGLHIRSSWDYAQSTSGKADYTVGLIFGTSPGGDFYIIDMYRKKVDLPTAKRESLAFTRQWDATSMLIEDVGVGRSMIALLQGCGLSILSFKPQRQGDKLMRFEAATEVMEAGNVYLPENAPWLGQFLDEILNYPSSRNDDIVDTLSQMLLHWRRSGRNRGMGKVNGY